MKLNNFEIRRLDALNITYKEYREVENIIQPLRIA